MICNKCKQDLDLSNFHFKNKERGIRKHICKICQREYVNRHYQNNKERVMLQKKNRIKNKVAWFAEIKKDFVCSNCGESCSACLDFHHNDPKEKEYGISCLVRRGTTEIKILEEISKCTVLCSNCHRKLHNGLL